MNTEILLIALAIGFSQASFTYNVTVNSINDPNNIQLPCSPTDPVQMFYWGHIITMSFSGMQNHFQPPGPHEEFLDCLDSKRDIYFVFAKTFKKNITDIIEEFAKNYQKISLKPKKRAEKALIEIADFPNKFGKDMERSLIEEDFKKAIDYLLTYEKRIMKIEFTLVKALNKLAEKYLQDIKKIDDKLRKISIETQKDALNFISTIHNCITS